MKILLQKIVPLLLSHIFFPILLITSSAFTPNDSVVQSTIIALIGSLDSLIGSLETYSIYCSSVKSPISSIYSFNGSLDVERIRKLSYEEKRREMSKFTKEQMEEYFSKAPIKESHMPITPVKVDYKMEDLLARGYATAEQILKIIDDSM